MQNDARMIKLEYYYARGYGNLLDWYNNLKNKLEKKYQVPNERCQNYMNEFFKINVS